METLAGTSLQENEILSSREKLGHGQREGRQVKSTRNEQLLYIGGGWRKKGFISEAETESRCNRLNMLV